MAEVQVLNGLKQHGILLLDVRRFLQDVGIAMLKL